MKVIVNLSDLIKSCFLHIEGFNNIKIIATYTSEDYKEIIDSVEIDKMTNYCIDA